MKPIEKLTEKLARQLCKERGVPSGMRELLLGDAYQLVYFGDKTELEALVKRANADKEYESFGRRTG